MSFSLDMKLADGDLNIRSLDRGQSGFCVSPRAEIQAVFGKVVRLATLVLTSLFAASNVALGQASNVATLQEATGSSVRDFNAIRALSRDYLDNPDGGETPVDEDDLWFPDMALAKKDVDDQVEGVRVITYNDGKAQTQSLNSGNPVTNSAPSNIPSSIAKEKTTSNISAAGYESSAATAGGIRQTAGFADYSLGGTDPAYPQGFADYQLSDSERSEETSTYGDFPSAIPFLGGECSVPDNSASEIERDILKDGAAYPSVPATNSGLDALLSNAETEPSAQPAEKPRSEVAEDDATFPIVEVAMLDEPIQEAPVARDAQMATPKSDSVASEPEKFETSGNVESKRELVAAANGETYKPIDLLGVPATDHTVLNGDDEPFRESYRVSQTSQLTEGSARESLENGREAKSGSLETASLSEEELKNLTVADIRISGLEMTAQQFNKIVKTRIGAKFSQQRLEEDKRALMQTKQFIDVAVSTSWTPDKPDQVIVNFDLTTRRMMRYIKIVGNRKISKHDILEELGLRPGESRMDPYEVENGRLRIIEFYKSKDYGEPHVEILRGNRPEDVGVVYLIDEGLKQRVLSTKFVGNSIVSSARLHSLVSVKPGVLYFIGGTFTRERLDADVEKLLEYYRNLGYFDARIDREYEESKWFGGLGKDNAWVSVRYIIDEGPRYKIRNFTFSGNRVVPSKELEKQLKVKRGSYYRFDEIEADRIALRYKYQDLGYVRADITPNQIFTDEVGYVDIRYDIEEDHRYRVSDVIVDYVGTESRTMTPVVLNMLDITPGELLNGKKIRMSENTLRQSGYFNDKPSEGQLPEIAVVPDESRYYKLNEEGKAELVGESRKEKEGEKKEESARDTGTIRGQSRDIRTLRNNENTRFASYIPYETAKKATLTSQKTNGNNASYIAYGPNESPKSEQSAKKANVGNAAGAPVSARSLIRGQTRQIPSGFSTTTTQSAKVVEGSYQAYDSSKAGSQFTDGLDYANGASANLLNSNATLGYDQYDSNSSRSVVDTDGTSSTPGFSDGVYGSIGKEILEPITPEEDEIYDGAVLVKVQEGRTGMFQASIGVNSDYGLVGNVSFTERNFNLFRPPTSLFRADGWKDAFRGGGQIFSVQASPGTSVQSYRVSWDVPYVFNTKYLFGVTGLYGEHSFDEWFEARYGGELRVGRQWTPRFSTTINGGLYNVKIKDPAVGFVPELNEVLGTNKMFNVGLTAAYDTRNHPYSPSAGYLLKGSVEAALGDYNFPRATLDGRIYKTLHKRVDGTGRWVLGFSSHLGWTGDDTPIYERYYGGGSQNLRGFEYREVTPRYLNTNFGIGGKFEFYNTVEFFVPISGGDEFQLAFFVDTGTVAESMKKWGRYRVAPGVGLRFSIPMLGPAPLALDFAFPVSKDPNDVTEVFTFNLSGSR